MKNRYKTLILFCVLAIGTSVLAQEYNINFHHDLKWKKALKMAKKQNKLIFVDAYTTWCGPCKTLAKEVFTQEKVANYFNENFINLKVDMEKGEGITLKDTWKVSAYPTLLFINADGVIEHTVVGASGADEFLRYAKMALDDDLKAINLQKKYDEGNREPTFMYNYLFSLRLGYLKDKEREVANAYLASLTKDDLLKVEYWDFIKDFVNDPSSKKFEYIVTNRQKLYDVVGKEAVNEKIYNTYADQLQSWSYWIEGNAPFETEKEESIINFLQASDYDKAPTLLSKLLANKYKREGKNELYLATLDYIVQFNLEKSPRAIVDYASTVLKHFESSNIALAKALNWINIADAKEKRVEHRVAILETKSKLLTKLGNKTEAELAALAAKKAEDAAIKAGTKINSVPAFQMLRMKPKK
ncbi:thioredoxin domain-containing protein [Flavobacteriaceae bacterium F08102]|nr:thioredoxin domain-containing protein [Flavobacteriaceae bacterium F08102]